MIDVMTLQQMRDQIAGADCVADALRDGAQQPVTGRVADDPTGRV